MKCSRIVSLVLAASALVASLTALPTRSLALTTYDAALNFSWTANPNGVWSYGYATTLTSAFIPYAIYKKDSWYSVWPSPISGPSYNYGFAGIGGWFGGMWFPTLHTPEYIDPSAAGCPYIIGNVSTSTASLPYPDGTCSTPGWTLTANPNCLIDKYRLAMHPGPHDEYSVLRFTAPIAGTYVLHAVFTNGDDFTTTDVHVLKAGAEVFTIPSSGMGPGSGWAPVYDSNWDPITAHRSVSLAVGDTIEIRVGPFGPPSGGFPGSGREWQFDSTGVHFDIQGP